MNDNFVLLLHPDASAHERFTAAVPPPCACSSGSLDPSWPRPAVVVLHTRLADWRDRAARLRREQPELQLIVLADTVEAASVAVTEFCATRLLHREDQIPAAVAAARATPPRSAQRLEGEVQQRTATLLELERQAKLARADKTSAVGKLAGAIVHQLNSPMTSILVFGEALLHKTSDDDELHQHAAEVVEAAQRCRQLLQGLLRFARRPRAAEAGGVPLAAVIAEVLPLVQHRLELAGIALALDLPTDLPAVRAPRSDLEHVLVDLLTNAIDACPSAATIRLSARHQAAAGMVELVVQDNGRGMTPEVLQAACDPFFTTQPAGQAAGLGLPTCEAILGALGGTLTLESALDHGTSVRVVLPAVTSPPADPAGGCDE